MAPPPASAAPRSGLDPTCAAGRGAINDCDARHEVTAHRNRGPQGAEGRDREGKVRMNKTINPITGKRTYTEQVNGGELVIEIRTSKADRRSKHDLMNLWVKNGHLPEFIPERLHVDTYFYDEDGRCWGYYNPTERRGGAGRVIDFDWMLPATPENEQRIIDEVLRMAREDIRCK